MRCSIEPINKKTSRSSQAYITEHSTDHDKTTRRSVSKVFRRCSTVHGYIFTDNKPHSCFATVSGSGERKI